MTASLHQFRLCWKLYKNVHTKLGANFILFLVFTAYDYGNTKTKAKEEEKKDDYHVSTMNTSLTHKKNLRLFSYICLLRYC